MCASRSRSSPARGWAAACLLLGWILAHPAGAQAQAGPAPAVEVRGATLLEYDGATGVLRAEGAPVSVFRGTTVLRAARIRFDTRAGTVSAAGGVEVADPGLAVRAEAVEFRMADEHVRASGGVVVRSVRDGEATVLSAPEAEGWLRARRFSASGGVSVERGNWMVSGRTLDYDAGRGMAVVTGDPVARLGQATVTARVITFLTAEEVARAEGAVVLRREDVVGSAPRAEVFGREGKAVLSGGAAVERGRDRVTAEVIEIALDGSRVTGRGASRLVITPP